MEKMYIFIILIFFIDLSFDVEVKKHCNKGYERISYSMLSKYRKEENRTGRMVM